MAQRPVEPYALQAGAGTTYDFFGVGFTVKAGELGLGRRLAFLEYTTRAGEEPPDHTHPTEDEIFYVLEGALTFRCGARELEVADGGFVFLPRGIEHGYRIRSSGDVRLLIVTAPIEESQEGAPAGWNGFVADLETLGTPRTGPTGGEPA